ncbi:MAG: leucine-rich repeat protein [Clostridia bacterium]|nr:leucine-rich repeat protein [Clostridia bacterium]
MIKRIIAVLLALMLCGGALAEAVFTLNVNTIEDEAFMNDTALTSISLPASTLYIGNNAFANCTALKTIYCLSPDAVIEENAFDGVTGAEVYCYIDSTMDVYARAKGFTVKYLDSFEIEYETAFNPCAGIPLTWKVVKPMSTHSGKNSYVYEIYKQGESEPVHVSASTESTQYKWTPDSAGSYYARITLTNPLTVSTQTSEEISVSDKLYIGVYEQDANENTQDALEWTVLSVQGDKALVITTYVIKNASYFNPSWIKYKYTYWSGSYIGTISVNYRGSGPESDASRITGITPTHIPLKNGSWGVEADLYPLHARYWCNETFYNSAFTDEERARIMLVTNTNENSPDGIKGGPDTQDHVFFLSYNEANAYMPGSGNALRKTTQTTVAKNENKSNTGSVWWLRSPGKYRVNAMYITGTGGSLSTYGSDVGHSDMGYRPAMWVKIS